MLLLSHVRRHADQLQRRRRFGVARRQPIGELTNPNTRRFQENKSGPYSFLIGQQLSRIASLLIGQYLLHTLSLAVLTGKYQESMMNKEQVEGKFEQIKGKLKETWGKLTDNDITLYDGKREQFLGKLKEHYGLAKEDAELKVKALEDTWDAVNKNKPA